MKYITNKEALFIQNFIQSLHYEAYFVGGCVRDLLLERNISDYDITTNCEPSVLLELAKKHGYFVIPTGLKHGTITFVLNHHHIEVTTYRKEDAYINHRFPSSVSFTPNLYDDLSRRDFTINALAMNQTHIIDHFDGIKDLEHKKIRCINNPNNRFQEDALRMLRAIRFHFTLDFSIETHTFNAIRKNAHLLSFISRERIRDEFCKILNSNQKDILIYLKDAKVLLEIIPEATLLYNTTQETPYHIYDVFHHTNTCLNACIKSDLVMKLAILLHDIEKKHYKTIDTNGIAHFKGHAQASALLSKKILRRLAFDNKTIQEVANLIEYHDYYLTTNTKQIRKFLFKLQGNYSLAYRILDLQKIDNLGKNPSIFKEKNKIIDQVITQIKEIQEKGEAFHIKDLTINGSDLINLGFQQKEIGIALNQLLKYVLNQQGKNNKEHLLKIAGGMKNEIISCE